MVFSLYNSIERTCETKQKILFADAPLGATAQLKWTSCIIHNLLKRPCSAVYQIQLIFMSILFLYPQKLERHPIWKFLSFTVCCWNLVCVCCSTFSSSPFSHDHLPLRPSAHLFWHLRPVFDRRAQSAQGAPGAERQPQSLRVHAAAAPDMEGKLHMTAWRTSIQPQQPLNHVQSCTSSLWAQLHSP